MAMGDLDYGDDHHELDEHEVPATSDLVWSDCFSECIDLKMIAYCSIDWRFTLRLSLRRFRTILKRTSAMSCSGRRLSPNCLLSFALTSKSKSWTSMFLTLKSHLTLGEVECCRMTGIGTRHTSLVCRIHPEKLLPNRTLPTSSVRSPNIDFSLMSRGLERA